MPQNYCHHINATGLFCRGIPLKQRDYCYWHLHERGRRMKAARARAHSQSVTIQLPVLDDLHAVQLGLMQLGEAIAHGEIDDRRGRLLLAVLRLAASNIKAQGDWLDEAQMRDCNDSACASESAAFEQQYGLRKGFDLSLEPQVAFPPPPEIPGAPHIPGVGICGNDETSRARLRQILRDATSPIPGCDFQTTADDMELMDVYERHGEQAGLRCASQLERNRKRLERRERRMHYEQLARNRNIQLAAEKLLADQRRNAQAVEPGADPENDRKPPQSQGNNSAVQNQQSGPGRSLSQ